jgi:hypothetical protein
MWKLLLLVSLLPIVATILLRKWCCDRVLQQMKGKITNQAGHLLVGQLLRHRKLASEIEYRQKKKTRLMMGPPLVIQLSNLAWNGRDVLNLGILSNLVGRALITHEHRELVNWREWAVRFGWAFPSFTLLVVVFAVAVAKIPVMIGIVIVLGSIGIASGLLLASMMVELESAKQAAILIEESRAHPRQEDGEEVARCCRALAWQRVVPGCLEWLVSNPLKEVKKWLEAQEKPPRG